MTIRNITDYVTVKVNRATWLTGSVSRFDPDIGSCLRSTNSRVNGFQCCLGFACNVAGISNKAQNNAGQPRDLKNDAFARWARTFPYAVVSLSQLIETNDNEKLTSDRREKQIRKLGLAVGITFVFYGEYPSFLKTSVFTKK